MPVTQRHAEKKQCSLDTVQLTTAQALIHYLSVQYIEGFEGDVSPLFGGMWGIFGHGNVAGIAEALWEYRSSMPHFRGQNEQAMAHAAIAYAKAHRARRVMGVTTSIGPGATNMVTAAALAHINRLPVLFLPGDNFASRRPDPVLQQLEDEKFPSASVNDTFIPVSRFFDRISRPEQLLHSLPFAMETLIHPLRRGPVTLALPQDTQTEVFAYPLSFFETKIHKMVRPRPDYNQVMRCAKLLAHAKRPVIIAGGGVHYSGAEKNVLEFSKKRGIPVVETQAGKGALPWDFTYNLGAIGVTGTSAANAIAEKADLIICMGTRLSDFTTASKSLFPNIPFIGINISSFDAIKQRAEPMEGDLLACLEEWDAVIGNYMTDLKYREEAVHLKQIWESQHQAAVAFSSSLPTDAQVLAVVNCSVGHKDIVVCAAGGLPGELHKHWKTQDPIGYHVEYGYSCMGYEIAGGLGVKIARPEKEVYVLVGDGSYLMMHTELLTSIQLGYKINVVLLDNGGFGCINRLQKNCGVPAFGNLFDPSAEVKMDFVKNAASYGCHAAKANTLQELETILHANKLKKETCVTVIETDPQKGSPGYAWWDVAIPEFSKIESVQKAREEYMKHLRFGG